MTKPLSILSANVLFFASMLAVATLGSLMQLWNLSVGLIATEVLLILLPAVLLLRARRIPLREGLRLNPIRPLTGLVSLLLGIAVFLFSVLIEAVMAQLSRMPAVDLPSSSLPAGGLDAALYFIGLAIFAPFCEEVLFRGAIQTAYEQRRSAAFAILLTGWIFAFYHMRLSGLVGILPVCFILGYVAWRTQSIYASMLVHFGMNASSAANALYALAGSGRGFPFLSLETALAGLLATVVLLILLNRLQPAPAPRARVVEEEPKRPWIRQYWPLVGGGVIYLAATGLTLAAALSPEAQALTDLKFFPPRVEGTIESRYRITNPAGEKAGDLACRVIPQGSKVRLECSGDVQGYEIKTASSYFKDMDHSLAWQAVWDSKTLDLVDFQFERKGPQGSGYTVAVQEGQLVVTYSNGTEQTGLADSFLLEYEWLWRANDLDTSQGSLFTTPYGYLFRWNESQKKSVPFFKTELLRVNGMETLNLPAGQFQASKVSLANQTAWYAQNDAKYPRPVQFSDGVLTYALEP